MLRIDEIEAAVAVLVTRTRLGGASPLGDTGVPYCPPTRCYGAVSPAREARRTRSMTSGVSIRWMVFTSIDGHPRSRFTPV